MGLIEIASSPLSHSDLEFMRSSIEIPSTLMQYLLLRPQDIDRIRFAIANAVEHSFNHPDTRMRNPTQRELKVRAQLAMDIVNQLYQENLLVVSQIVDQLQDLLIGIIRDVCAGAGETDIEEAASKKIDPGRWTVDLPGGDQPIQLDEQSVDLTEEAKLASEDETGEDALEGLGDFLPQEPDSLGKDDDL